MAVWKVASPGAPLLDVLLAESPDAESLGPKLPFSEMAPTASVWVEPVVG